MPTVVAPERVPEGTVYAMPIWESQQFILRELYGIQASALIDVDDFSIRFDEPASVRLYRAGYGSDSAG